MAVLGTILPARRVRLGFAVGGLVRRVYVELGQEVTTGDLLAGLDTAALESDVCKAEEALALSLARLKQARAGPREEAVEVAKAEYRRVLAQHEALLSGVHPEEVRQREVEPDVALREPVG